MMLPLRVLPRLFREIRVEAQTYTTLNAPRNLLRAAFFHNDEFKRRSRAMLHQWLATIHMVWPECPATICSDGRYLSVRPAKAILERSETGGNSQGGSHVRA
jgi:hypothetical protein